MKKLCLLTVLILLFSSCAASGEQLTVSWEIGSGDHTESGTAQILLSGESVILTSTLLNDYAVITEQGWPAGMEAEGPGFLKAAEQPDTYRQQIQRIWNEWLAGRPSDTVYGFFTGDSFESASTETTWHITWSDLAVLIHKIQEIMPDEFSADAVKALEDRYRDASLQDASWFRLCQYDNGKALSLSVIRNGEVFATGSVDLSDPQNMTSVTGWAENGKDYYFSTAFHTAQEGLTWHAELLADDACAGYRGLPANALILSANGSIRTEGKTLLAEMDILPANGTGPCCFSCSVRETSAELRVSYGEEKLPLLLIRGGKEPEDRDALLQGKTIVHAEQMTAEEKNTLSGILLGHGIGMIYKLYQILPAEIMTLLQPEL